MKKPWMNREHGAAMEYPPDCKPLSKKARRRLDDLRKSIPDHCPPLQCSVCEGLFDVSQAAGRRAVIRCMVCGRTVDLGDLVDQGDLIDGQGKSGGLGAAAK